MSEWRVRPEEPADARPVRAVLTAAFGREAEASLVEALRAAGDPVLALVAEAKQDFRAPAGRSELGNPASFGIFGGWGEVAGHIVFSRLRLNDPTIRASALAPLAVRPDRQRQGVGLALVRVGLRRLAGQGEDLVLVLGEPDYYRRFGFTQRDGKRFATLYDGPHQQALALSRRGRSASGPVAYPDAFQSLG